MPINKKKSFLIKAEARSGVAYIRLVDAISEYGDSSSAIVRLKVDSFLSQGITTAEVYINGRGGDCFEATEIANELERFGKENVSLKVGALAASAFTYLVASFKTTANANSQFMIHRPSLGTYGNVDEVESDLVLLRNTTALYKTRYALKTGKTEEEIETLWAKGDVWLTAQEALELGLIDEIHSDEELEITAEVRTLLEACGAPVIPELTNKEKTMDRLELIAALGLDADATDAQIVAAVKAAKLAQVSAQSNADSEEQKKAKAGKALVAKAVKEKKISAELSEHYESWATHNYEGCEKALDAMTTIPKLSAELNRKGPNEATLEARTGWSYEKWMEEDPKGLMAMADDNTDEFNRIFNKQ